MIVEIFLQSNEKYYNYQNIITTFYQFSPITATEFFTMRIESLLVLLYVTCIAISLSIFLSFSETTDNGTNK